MSIDNIEVLTGSAAVAEGEKDLGGTGFRRPPRDPQYNAKLVEAANIWGDAMYEGGAAGFTARARLMESLTTSDFPVLLGAVFDRELLDQYQQATPVWQQFARRTVVRDFKPKSLVDLLGGRGILDPVGEGAEYPARKVTEAEYKLQVGKRGARIPLTWEMIVNDDLDAFRDLPDRLAQGARDTESHIATSQLVRGPKAADGSAQTSGVNTDFFKTANGNAPTALPLTADNLDQAITAVSTRKDSEGRPVVISGFVLVVPPALETQALRITSATEIELTDAGTGQKLRVGNYLSGKVTVVVNPWLTVVATDAKAATRWFLLPAPTAARPAVTVGFLRGHEDPDLRVKSSTGQRVGGGTIDPRDGNFDDDSIEYRARHVVGGATTDPIGTYVSNGS